MQQRSFTVITAILAIGQLLQVGPLLAYFFSRAPLIDTIGNGQAAV
jgi:hypothetical protein